MLHKYLIRLLFPVLLGAQAGAAVAAPGCSADLEAIAAFLPVNDAGARDHLASHGERIERALRQARLDAAAAAGAKECDAVLDAYLAAWRPGHLSVTHLDSGGAAPRPAPGTPGDPRMPRIEVLGQDSILLVIPTFNDRYAKPLRELLEAQRTQLAAHKYWIIDLRENGGGADSTYAPLLPWLLDSDYPSYHTEYLATPANIQAQEAVCAQLSDPASCQATLGPVVRKMRAAPPGSLVPGGAQRMRYAPFGKREPVAPARVAVLTDRDCGSTCEEFLLTVRTGFRVKLVGRPSAGVLDISNMRPHPLPSGRVLRYGTTRSTRLPDMRIDTIGIPPDVLLPRPADEAGKKAEVAQVQRWLETGAWQ